VCSRPGEGGRGVYCPLACLESLWRADPFSSPTDTPNLSLISHTRTRTHTHTLPCSADDAAALSRTASTSPADADALAIEAAEHVQQVQARELDAALGLDCALASVQAELAALQVERRDYIRRSIAH
jgi:hypothetical protein